jgi:hypothetical protein
MKPEEFIVSELADELISLYYTEEEGLKEFFAIVRSDTNLDKEKELNVEMHDKFGEEFVVYFIPLASLEGNEIKGYAKYFSPERLIKVLPYYRFVYGKKFNFRDFPVKPMELKQEALFLIKRIEKQLETKEDFRRLVKSVIELVRVEAEKEKGFEYDPSFRELVNHLKLEEDHILHSAYSLMFKNPSELEKGIFYDRVRDYINELKARIESW